METGNYVTDACFFVENVSKHNVEEKAVAAELHNSSGTAIT